MHIFSVAPTLLVLAIARSSAEIVWDYGNWSPIPGRCPTCEKGRVLFFESTQRQSSNKILGQEPRNKRKPLKTDELSLFTSNFRGQRANNDKVQLVYLPEGSINDLRIANVARVSSKERVLSRSRRSTPYELIPLVSEPLDLATGESTVTFSEVSPRMPMALVAERGKEREAHEQIQLLEAALRAQPTNIHEGELPRVFIAPTNLPPPPGYVKIPLLPNKNHIQRKKALPGTFLTSEFHQELPPGFIQVPLPQKIAQLSHGIPFVDPKSNNALRAQTRTQQGQQLKSDFRSRQPQQQQPNHNFFQSQQNFIAGQPVQTDSRGQQHFNINRPSQHGQFPQQVIPEDRSAQPQIPNREFSRHEPAPNFIPIPVIQSPKETFAPERPRQRTSPKIIVEQDSRLPPNSQKPSSFIEIGSSVIQPLDSFSDFPTLDIPDIPDFGNIENSQNFDAIDNQAFENPNIISHPKSSSFDNTRETETPRQKTVTEFRDHVETLDTLKTLPEIQVDRDQITIAPVDITKNTPFQLSPKPIERASLLDSPVKSKKTHSSKKVPSIQSIVTPGTPIQISPKPVVAPIETPKIRKTVRPTSRRRLRPHSPARRPNRIRQPSNLQEGEVLRVAQNSITKGIDTSTDQPTPTTARVNPRSRFNFNRRRRPSSKQETVTTQSTSSNVIKPGEETATILPPFSIAKTLNEHNSQVENKGKDNSLLRSRFGSRIRPRIRNFGANVEDPSTSTTNGAAELPSDGNEQVVGSQRRQLHQRGQRRRFRGRNGRPVGKRRRVLSRVRKISAPNNNRLNGDELRIKNELRGSESARVLISHDPASQSTDPITQTLDLINRKEDSPGKELKDEEFPDNGSKVEESVTVTSDGSPSTDVPDNIFNLLNIGRLNSDSSVATSSILNENQPLVESDLSPFQTDSIGKRIHSSR